MRKDVETFIGRLGNLPKSPGIRPEFVRVASSLCQMVEERCGILGDSHFENLTVKFAVYCAKRQWNFIPITGELPTLADAICGKIDGLIDPTLTLKKIVDLHRAHNRQAAATLRRDLLANPAADIPPEEMARSGDYRLVECRTQRHLQEETATLGHCVGGTHLDHYRTKMASGDIRIFSLRTSKEIPVCTIEYDTKSKSITQIEGKRRIILADDAFFPSLCGTLHALGKKILIGAIEGLPHRDGEILIKDGSYVPSESIDRLLVEDMLAGTVVVNDTTDLSVLSKVCACARLKIDVTKLDLSRLPLEIKGGLQSHAPAFDAPTLQTAGDIDADLAVVFKVAQLRRAGNINADSARVFKVPSLRSAGDIHAETSSRFEAPQLRTSGDIYAESATVLRIPQLRHAGEICADSARRFNAPELLTVGSVSASGAMGFRTQKLQKAGEINVGRATVFVIAKLQHAYDINASFADKFRAPELTSSGNIEVRYAKTFHAPKLKEAGDIYAVTAKTVKIPSLEQAEDIHVGSATRFHAPRLKRTRSINAGSASTFVASHLKSSVTTQEGGG